MLWIDHKYVGLISIRLPKFKRKSDKLYNFRCVFCGDSQKDKNKTRGYLYVHKDRISYKCHNCNLSTSLFKTLEHLDPSIAKAYKLETFSNSGNSIPSIVADTSKFKPMGAISNTVTMLTDLGLVPLTEMPNRRVMEYVESRKIPKAFWSDLYYAQDMKVLENLNPNYKDRILSEERLVIPFRDRTGNITGATGRALGNNKLRYVTVRVSDAPMVYGLNRIDLSRTVYVVEGPIDSMFVDNAIAAGGSDFQRAVNMVPKENAVLVFDNQPRNSDLVKIMTKMISYDYKMVIWPKNWLYKDINEAIVDGVTHESLMHTLYTNTHNNLALKLAMREWNKCR